MKFACYANDLVLPDLVVLVGVYDEVALVLVPPLLRRRSLNQTGWQNTKVSGYSRFYSLFLFFLAQWVVNKSSDILENTYLEGTFALRK